MRKLISRYLWLVYKQHKRVILTVSLVIAVIILGQLVYPRSRLVPFAHIDTIDVSNMSMASATQKLDAQMAQQKINIKLGDGASAYSGVLPHDIGLTINNEARVKAANYPWYMRLIPTSLLWQHFFLNQQQPTYTRNNQTLNTYLNSLVGSQCVFKPKDATLAYQNKTLVLVNAQDGGRCDYQQAVAAFKNTQPTISHPATVAIDVTKQSPAVNDSAANTLKSQILAHTNSGITISVNKETKNIPQDSVLSLLTFAPKDKTLMYDFDLKKAGAYFSDSGITKLVTKSPVNGKVTTRDFTIIARTAGNDGTALSLPETLNTIRSVIDGTASSARVYTTVTRSQHISYTRTYTKTPTGIRALVTQYGQDNAGTFGIDFKDLKSGADASYNGSKQFVAASTYKLYVAYGTLRRIDSGQWKWSNANISNGRNLSTCFDAMIKVSDNACAEALLNKIGRSQLTAEIHSQGFYGSTFLTSNAETTANDLSLFLQKLQNSQLGLASASRSRLINDMSVQIYRQGIPAGASGNVADKVGFLGGLLHDAAIVYSPKGTYVLTIMSNGSSWSHIAELTRKIESLR